MSGPDMTPYDRGLLDGKTAARLDGHDARLDAHDVLLQRVVSVEATLTLAVQSLADAADAREKAALATAAALKDEREAKALALRNKATDADQVVIPWARILTAAAILTTIGIYLLSRGG